MKLIHKETGVEPKKGDKLVDFRGTVHRFIEGVPPHKPSSTGRIYTDKGGFFPSVCGLRWIEKEVKCE